MRERVARYVRRLLGLEAIALELDVLTLRVALLEKGLARFIPPEDVARRDPDPGVRPFSRPKVD